MSGYIPRKPSLPRERMDRENRRKRKHQPSECQRLARKNACKKMGGKKKPAATMNAMSNTCASSASETSKSNNWREAPCTEVPGLSARRQGSHPSTELYNETMLPVEPRGWTKGIVLCNGQECEVADQRRCNWARCCSSVARAALNRFCYAACVSRSWTQSAREPMQANRATKRKGRKIALRISSSVCVREVARAV